MDEGWHGTREHRSASCGPVSQWSRSGTEPRNAPANESGCFGLSVRRPRPSAHASSIVADETAARSAGPQMGSRPLSAGAATGAPRGSELTKSSRHAKNTRRGGAVGLSSFDRSKTRAGVAAELIALGRPLVFFPRNARPIAPNRPVEAPRQSSSKRSDVRPTLPPPSLATQSGAGAGAGDGDLRRDRNLRTEGHQNESGPPCVVASTQTMRAKRLSATTGGGRAWIAAQLTMDALISGGEPFSALQT